MQDQDITTTEVTTTSTSSSVSQAANQAWLLPASIVIAALIIGGSIIYLVHSPQRAPTVADGTASTTEPLVAPAVADRDVVLGNADAPVSIIEYGDFQCPFCSAFFQDTEPTIRQSYIQTGKVKMVFRNFSFLGPESDAAAAAAECAKDQRHFWEYHDALYNVDLKDGKENSGDLTRTLFIKLASDLKLDTTAFTSCIDKGTYVATVQQQTQDAQKYGVNSTPTFFINGTKVEGALPTSQFTAAIEAALLAR